MEYVFIITCIDLCIVLLSTMSNVQVPLTYPSRISSLYSYRSAYHKHMFIRRLASFSWGTSWNVFRDAIARWQIRTINVAVVQYDIAHRHSKLFFVPVPSFKGSSSKSSPRASRRSLAHPVFPRTLRTTIQSGVASQLSLLMRTIISCFVSVPTLSRDLNISLGSHMRVRVAIGNI